MIGCWRTIETVCICVLNFSAGSLGMVSHSYLPSPRLEAPTPRPLPTIDLHEMPLRQQVRGSSPCYLFDTAPPKSAKILCRILQQGRYSHSNDLVLHAREALHRGPPVCVASLRGHAAEDVAVWLRASDRSVTLRASILLRPIVGTPTYGAALWDR